MSIDWEETASKEQIIDKLKRCIAELEGKLREAEIHKKGLASQFTAKIEQLESRIAELKRMQTIADDNLKAAADKAGITYMGCDTPDALAERIAELEDYNIFILEENTKHQDEIESLDMTLKHLWRWLPTIYQRDYLKDYPTHKDVLEREEYDE